LDNINAFWRGRDNRDFIMLRYLRKQSMLPYTRCAKRGSR